MRDYVLIGLGGTGSHLAEPLYRLLSYHKNAQARCLHLVDGDTFEERNAERQLFNLDQIGLNKAAVAAARLSALNQQTIPVTASEFYLNNRNSQKFFSMLENPVVITAVDNHATRNLVLQQLQSHPYYLVVNPGNSLDKGVVSLERKEDGLMLTTALTDRYADIAQPQDRIPNSCAEQAPSTPQLITANAFAATISLSLIQAYLDQERLPEEVIFDSRSWKTKALT